MYDTNIIFIRLLFAMSIVVGIVTGVATTHWVFMASKEFFYHTIKNIDSLSF
jgi:ABC-type transporter Mla maintaining outer membrane lipid asymmetry permease subunit MlaE